MKTLIHYFLTNLIKVSMTLNLFSKNFKLMFQLYQSC